MIMLKDPAQLTADYKPLGTALLMASLSTLLQQRLQLMGEDGIYDPEQHGYLVIAEPGDDIKTMETETGPIFSDWLGVSHGPDAGFAPSFEYAIEYPLCYELVFVANDSGFAILVFVPKLTGIDAQLLSLCREYID